MVWVWLLHLAATGTMFGLIWIVQVVHYPLFAEVGPERFTVYEAHHQVLITWIVLPAMTIELVTGVILTLRPPPPLPAAALWWGLGLIGVVWLSTAFLQVPLHRLLSAGFDADVHARLVGTNWIRTAAWTIRFALVLWLTGLWIR